MSGGVVQLGRRSRAAAVRRGKRLEYLTILYNSLEGLVAIVSGLVAGSIALVGFGFDSVIEVTSGAALLWRLSADVDERARERAEAYVREALAWMIEDHVASRIDAIVEVQG